MIKQEQFVIGVDGGGTKTTAALADLKSVVLKTAKAGPSSPRNVGPKKSAETLARIIRELGVGKSIVKIIVGLASVEEQPDYKEKIRFELPRELRQKLEIVSDQLIAFRSATDKKNGALLIAGTGCVAHGWKDGKEAKASGWGWLEDKGSAFWAGREALIAIFSALDQRGPETMLKDIAFSELGVERPADLLNYIYENFLTEVPCFSIFCDIAAGKGDKVAQGIMKRAGQELALSAKTVIKKLGFQKAEFPLVLVGGMFKSKIVEMVVKKEVKKFAPKTDFIRPEKEPVYGAIKLAIERL